MKPHGDSAKSCFSQDFYFKGQPHIRFKGILNQPPEESRWGAIPAWLLNVPHGTKLDFSKRQVVSSSDPSRRFILADFRRLEDGGLSFRAYEANLNLAWSVREVEVNPITLQQQDTGKLTIENIDVYITEDFKMVNQDRNPNLYFHIITAEPIRVSDTLDGYKINQRYVLDGLFHLKVERIRDDGQ